MLKKSSLGWLTLLLATVACKAQVSPSPTHESQSRPTQASPEPSVRETAHTQPDTLAPTGFGTASLALGLDLLREFREPAQKNAVFSPLSISLAFAMPWAGARGETAAEMTRTLHYWDTPANVATEAARLLHELNGAAGQNTLRLVNRLFVQEGFHIEPQFLELARDQFAAPIERLNFLDSENARRQINARIADQTEARIPELLPPKSLDGLTRVVVTNAVYFLGQWQHPFPSESTAAHDFYVTDNPPKSVPMMRQTRKLPWAEGEGVSVLELPYAGGKTSMVILLPAVREGLSELEKRLTPAAVRSWLEELRDTEVSVVVPRLELRHSVQLKAPLRKLGMTQAFVGGADFRGIDPAKSLYVEEAYHQTFIKLDEQGTEASAATAVVMNFKSMQRYVPFVADHPFLFLIRDVRSGAILFLGRVDDPSP